MIGAALLQHPDSKIWISYKFINLLLLHVYMNTVSSYIFLDYINKQK